ncbi:hypothetical protein ACFYUJ_37995 [Streptomyces sp. NPDC004520]|uniref:hypothetical protein n=1 Tax=Streptomyces sp. NPDC004520 TaxID=3364702 RepID=UPI0036D17EF2
MPVSVSRRHRPARQARPVPPDTPVAALPGKSTAASDERARLLLIAAHMEHPLVAEALQELRTQGIDRQRRPGERAVVS